MNTSCFLTTAVGDKWQISSFAIGAAVFVTTALGWTIHTFLAKSVTIRLSPEVAEFEETTEKGGGRELGILERLLFFASAWLEAYPIAGAWLVFKIGAKWAVWQHITKIPSEGSKALSLTARNKLSCFLLGRFLNGTLYNMFCAAVGWIAANLARDFLCLRGPHWGWSLVAIILAVRLYSCRLISGLKSTEVQNPPAVSLWAVALLAVWVQLLKHRDYPVEQSVLVFVYVVVSFHVVTLRRSGGRTFELP